MERNLAQEFERRLDSRIDELKRLYSQLYHGDEKALADLLAMLRRAYEERGEALRELDRKREADPEWYKRRDIMGMLLYVNAFAKTLKGVERKLDYLEDCGVNYLHLMPLLESPKGRSDGGYAVADFRKVQPELGTMDDLSDLAAACHERGMSLCLDFVMNHSSEDHEWARRARAGEKESRSSSNRPFRRSSRRRRPATSPTAKKPARWS